VFKCLICRSKLVLSYISLAIIDKAKLAKINFML